MSLTGFRQAVASQLATALDIPFVDGKLDGPVSRQDLGCTFPGRTEELEGNVDIQQITVYVRVFKRMETNRRNPQVPPDPEPLEAIADLIPASLDDIQTAAGPWYFRVVSVEVDMDTQGVEAVVVGWAQNAFHSTS